MKHLKILGLAAVAAMALMALADGGTASATVLCKTPLTSECGSTSWHHVATDTTHWTLKTNTTTVFETTTGVVLDTCTEETTQAKIKTTGAPGVAVTTESHTQ